MPSGGSNPASLLAESAATPATPGIAASTESTVSIPSPAISGRPFSAGPKRTALPSTGPRDLRGSASGALAGSTGSSQVRWMAVIVFLLSVTAATMAGRRWSVSPSRWLSAGWKRSAGQDRGGMARARR